jgi:hypothetical protein
MPTHPAIKSIRFEPTVGGFGVGDVFRHRTLGECQVQAINVDDRSLTVVSVKVSPSGNNVYRLTQPLSPTNWLVGPA